MLIPIRAVSVSRLIKATNVPYDQLDRRLAALGISPVVELDDTKFFPVAAIDALRRVPQMTDPNIPPQIQQ